MVPSPRALAELALRRQEDLSRQLSQAPWSSSSSLLPSVLRRAIVTISVCHETLRSLEVAAENVAQTLSSQTRVARMSDGRCELRGRYGSVAVAIPIEGPARAQNGAVARLTRAHLALAVDSARVAYGDLLTAADWVAQRGAVDDLLEYLSQLESGESASAALTSLAQGARKIRILLDARRPNVESTNVLYRDLESLTVEGTAWCYCAALFVDGLRKPGGAADVLAAAGRVDSLRAVLERPHPTAPDGGPGPLYDERPRPAGQAKS